MDLLQIQNKAALEAAKLNQIAFLQIQSDIKSMLYELKLVCGVRKPEV